MQDLSVEVSGRVGSIATAWYQALVDSGNLPHTPELIRNELHTLTSQIIMLASDVNYQGEEARAIGARLALLGYKNIQVVGIVQPILFRHLSQGLEQNQIEAIHTRLGGMLIDLTAGFLELQHHHILLEREQALQSYETEWKRFIADRQEMEQKSQAMLRASEARYRSVVEDQTELIVRWKPDSTLTFVNEAACRFVGLTNQQLIGQSFFSIVPIDEQPGTGLFISSALTLTPKNPIAKGQSLIKLHYHEPRWVQWTNHALFNEDRQIIEFQTVGRDITDLRRFEDELRESEARYRNVVEGQTELIIRYLPDSTITFVNDALCRFFSQTREELLGCSVLNLVYGDDKPLLTEELAYLGNISPDNPIHTGWSRVLLANGDVRSVEWTTRVIFKTDGTVTEFQSVGWDITPLKQAQETLEQQNELLRQLGEQLISIQENERQRIARDLHDSVLNELGAMLISTPDVLTPKVVRDNYERLIEQLRQTINGLRTPMLNYGLHAALEDLFDRFMDNPQNEFNLTLEIPPNLARYDTNVESHLFRIIQQACDNAVQHAQAHNIRIHGRIEENSVDITVQDDGIGYQLDPDPDLAHVLAQKHFGLVSMLERGQLIGANVILSSQPGAGTQVRVYWASKEDRQFLESSDDP